MQNKALWTNGILNDDFQFGLTYKTPQKFIDSG